MSRNLYRHGLRNRGISKNERNYYCPGSARRTLFNAAFSVCLARKELLGIFIVIVREDICISDICFGIKSRRRSVKTENAAGSRNRFFRYTVISRIPWKAPALRYHSSYDLECPSLQEGSLWIHGSALQSL